MRIAMISKKGGVGKTTTTVSLAAALGRAGFRVLVIDMDPNAGASLSFGLSKGELAPGAGDVLLHGMPPAAAIRKVAAAGVWLLPASVDLRGAEVDLGQLSRKEQVLLGRLQGATHDFDYVILDCPSSLGLLTLNALVAADAFIVPAMPHFLALEGLEHVAETVDRLAQRTGRRTHFLGVLLTAVDYRIRSTRGNLRKIRERFGAKAFAVEIRTNVSLVEAPSFGQTIFDYRPYSTGARAYTLLAQEVVLAAAKATRNAGPMASPAASDSVVVG